MNIKDLKPLSSFAKMKGAKILGYGPPGGGKTPAIKTAPNPVALILESGTMSVRDAHSVAAWEGDTPKRIDEFFDWVARSNEAKQFDTICIDSLTQMAEIYLKHHKTAGGTNHGLKHYGLMADDVRRNVDILYYTWPKNVYAICKQDTLTLEGGSTNVCPGFPGKDLGQYVPHLFDIILYVNKMQIPGMPGQTAAFRSTKTFGIEARDRSGKLAEFEPQDLTYIIQKLLT